MRYSRTWPRRFESTGRKSPSLPGRPPDTEAMSLSGTERLIAAGASARPAAPAERNTSAVLSAVCSSEKSSARRAASRRAPPAAPGREKRLDLSSNILGIAWIERQSGVADHFRHGGGVGTRDRHTERHGFPAKVTESLYGRWKYEDMAGLVKGIQLCGSHVAEKPDTASTRLRSRTMLLMDSA